MALEILEPRASFIDDFEEAFGETPFAKASKAETNEMTPDEAMQFFSEICWAAHKAANPDIEPIKEWRKKYSMREVRKVAVGILEAIGGDEDESPLPA